MVNLTFKSVPHFFTATYDWKNHQITINIQSWGIYLPYTSDMKAVRDEFLKSQIRFDITSIAFCKIQVNHETKNSSFHRNDFFLDYFRQG